MEHMLPLFNDGLKSLFLNDRLITKKDLDFMSGLSGEVKGHGEHRDTFKFMEVDLSVNERNRRGLV